MPLVPTYQRGQTLVGNLVELVQEAARKSNISSIPLQLKELDAETLRTETSIVYTTIRNSYFSDTDESTLRIIIILILIIPICD